MTEIFHLADRRQWEAARAAGRYEISTRGKTLSEVGFIHCSQRHQVRPVADAIAVRGHPRGIATDRSFVCKP